MVLREFRGPSGMFLRRVGRFGCGLTGLGSPGQTRRYDTCRSWGTPLRPPEASVLEAHARTIREAHAPVRRSGWSSRSTLASSSSAGVISVSARVGVFSDCCKNAASFPFAQPCRDDDEVRSAGDRVLTQALQPPLYPPAIGEFRGRPDLTL
jgi:hypothetical protein